MAMIIKYAPPAYSSLQDDLVFVVFESVKTADPVTYPNYKYIADVYISGPLVSSTFCARIKRVQDPVNGFGIFNVGQIVRNYLTQTFNPATSGLMAQAIGNGMNNLNVTIQFGEEYNNAQYYSIISSGPTAYFNNYNGRLIGKTSSLIGFTDKIASNRTTNGQVLLTSKNFFIPYFPTTTGAISVTVTPDIGNPYSASITPTYAYDIQLLNVAPVNLNNLQAGTITAGTTYYTVNIGGSSFRIDLICEPIYNPYTLHFMNQFGGFETKIMSKVSHRTYDVTKSEYGRLQYTINSAGSYSLQSSNGVYNEIRTIYGSQFKEKMVLNSDFLTDAEYSWLAELVFSPMVYMEDGGYIFPVVIADKSYEKKRNINDDLTNLTLNIEFGNQLNAQYR